MLSFRPCTRRVPKGAHATARAHRLLGGAVAAWPLVAPAQQVGKPPVIGFLGASTSAAASQWTAAFVQRELGWIEGRTVAIQYRWAEGRAERFAEIAEEFVKLKVDVVATYGTPGTAAAKQATSTIPMVFASVGDPVGAGVDSNSAPIVTSLTAQTRRIQSP